MKYQEEVLPKHKLLVVEIDLEMFTATPTVMVKQIKLEAPDQNKLKKDFGKIWEGKRLHFVERCDRRAFVEAWEMLSDAFRDAFLEQQNERIDKKKTARKGEIRGFFREPVCQKPTPGFIDEVDVQIRKRKKLIDQIRSMSDVWKKVENADLGVTPWELRGERWHNVRQKGMTLFPTMSELWSQKELSQVGGREALMRVHKQMIVMTDQMHQKHRRNRWNHKVVKLQESCKAGSALLFGWIRNESRPKMRVFKVKRDDETTEELRTLIIDPEEIHEVIAKAWQDTFKVVKVRNADQERGQSVCAPNSGDEHMYTKEATVGCGGLAASSVMTTATSGIREVEKCEGGKCATSLVREGNVGCKWSSAASSGDK